MKVSDSSVGYATIFIKEVNIPWFFDKKVTKKGRNFVSILAKPKKHDIIYKERDRRWIKKVYKMK